MSNPTTSKIDRAFEHCCLYAGQDFVERHVKVTGDNLHLEFTGKDFADIVRFNFEIETEAGDFIKFLSFINTCSAAPNHAGFRTWSIAAVFAEVLKGRS